jgi:hypothetical protein
VIWDEERGEINELHLLYTDFNFKEANEAIQKTIDLMNKNDETGVSTKAADSNFDDWDDNPSSKSAAMSQSKKSDLGSEFSKKTGGSIVGGLDSVYSATSLSWNCKGTSLAVAYGKTNNKTWSECQSVVSIFQPFKRDFDPFKPSINIDTTTCMTEVAFHPTDAMILAGGSMNGEIYIWNIDEEDPKLYVSDIDEYYHREAITKLIWVR